MSDTEYTPTIEVIREYVMVGDPKPWEAPSPEVDERERRRGEAFDRALAAHDREVAAKAWDEGLDAGRDRWMDHREFGDPPVNPYAAIVSEPSTPEGENRG
tara:strand:- start:2864 stop:3166 length:303 start_codon:yes stop_codon:yes gene_type:complete